MFQFNDKVTTVCGKAGTVVFAMGVVVTVQFRDGSFADFHPTNVKAA